MMEEERRARRVVRWWDCGWEVVREAAKVVSQVEVGEGWKEDEA